MAALALFGMAAGVAEAQVPAPPGAPAQTAPATPIPLPSAPSPSTAGNGAAPPATGPDAPDNGRIALSAERLTYYSNVQEVTGQGGVRVQLDDGTVITGSYFAMNLVANRYLVAGDVHVQFAKGTVDGAAYSSYLDFNRTYFVPVISNPDRWTFFGHDYADPHPGREMPGDAFFIPNLEHQHIFLYAKHALITPRRFARFTGVKLSTTGAFVPVPSYVQPFSTNPNFAQNSLAGAYIDAPVNFAGGERSLETLHLRYDQLNKLYLSYEEHLVGDHGYAVFSMNPITRPQKQYNFLGSDTLTPAMSVGAFVQESTFQHNLSQPLSATAYGAVGMTIGLRRSFLGIGTNNFYGSLLAQPNLHPGYGGQLFYGDVTHYWNPDHPFFGGLGWNGWDTQVGKLPLHYQLRSGVGEAYDQYGEQFFGNTLYRALWYHYVGGTFYTPAFKLGGKAVPGNKAFYVNAVFDKQRTWYSLPHHVDVANTTFSLSRSFGTKLASYLAYNIINVGDFYNGTMQSLAYAPGSVYYIVNGKLFKNPFPDYASFRGFSTSRALSAGIAYTPSFYFQAFANVRKSNDWPEPIPPTGYNPYYIGRPPYELDLDTRFHFSPTFSVELARSYYFNWGGYAKWTPTYYLRTGL